MMSSGSGSLFAVMKSSARKIVRPVYYVKQSKKKGKYLAGVLVNIMGRKLFCREPFHIGIKRSLRLLPPRSREIFVQKRSFPYRYASSYTVRSIFAAVKCLVHHLCDRVPSLTRCRWLMRKISIA